MLPPKKSLSLFPEEDLQPAEEAVDFPSRRTKSAHPVQPELLAARASSLWLCLEFPHLSLEVYGNALSSRQPMAVIEESGTRSRLQACNLHAKALGVRPRMTVNAAFALVPDLRILNRNAEKEQQLLERLASWAGRYTALVSLEPPNALLLEVKGSLRLFRGLQKLSRHILDGLNELGYGAHWACAPTPLASLWLARAADGVVITEVHQLPGALGQVPLTCLRWPQERLTILRQMGVNVVADCLRLPRDGFARRLGSRWLEMLDRAMYRRPDPRQAFEPSADFRGEIQLPYEAHEIGVLLPVFESLLKELQGVLLARQAGVERLKFYLCHLDNPATYLRLDLVSPSRSAKHFMALLELKLENVKLPSPVIALRIQSESLRPLHTLSRGLFSKAGLGDNSSQMPFLVERLRARLGADTVNGVGTIPDHRPEAAWRFVEPGTETKIRDFKLRPLWMLVEPQRLHEREGQPCYQGRLILESGPERIETGWWDGKDVTRDYFVARHPGGRRLWLFRERRGRGEWFLHGAFG